MSQNGNYAATPAPAGVTINAANTNRDGTGTLGTVATAAAAGTRIDTIKVCGKQTTTAGMVRLFLDNGTSKFLFKEVPVTAITVSASQPGFEKTLSAGSDAELPLVLKTGWSLKASTHNAEAFDVTVLFAGDF